MCIFCSPRASVHHRPSELLLPSTPRVRWSLHPSTVNTDTGRPQLSRPAAGSATAVETIFHWDGADDPMTMSSHVALTVGGFSIPKSMPASHWFGAPSASAHSCRIIFEAFVAYARNSSLHDLRLPCHALLGGMERFEEFAAVFTFARWRTRHRSIPQGLRHGEGYGVRIWEHAIPFPT